MGRRVESPSSINTFKQCARKYYYQYILKLPTGESIHLLRGKLVHSVLEKFYEIDSKTISKENHREQLSFYIKNLFNAYWSKNEKAMRKCLESDKQLEFYYEESAMMMANWLTNFFRKIEPLFEAMSFQEAFESLKPLAIEEEFKDEQLQVRGFVDYIEEENGKIRIMDYKTSKSFHISDEYRLQLGIYALLYEKQHGQKPHEVGIWFLKDKEVTIPVTQELIDNARKEIEQIHLSTNSDKIEDYPVTITPLCKWKTGQCDFYDFCVKNR